MTLAAERNKHPIAIVNATVYAPEEVIAEGAVITAGARIQVVGRRAEVNIPEQARVIDAAGRRVVPGFIDLHIHGLEGQDVMQEGAVREVAMRLARHGVTAFLPTVTPVLPEEMEEVLAGIAAATAARPRGARPLGIHMEGPYLSPRQPGMLNPALFRPFTKEEFERAWRAAQGRVRLVTLAPEEADNMAAIPYLLDRGVVPSIGHSDATLAVVEEAMRHGLAHASHTYNAMRGFHHREPGVIGAIWLYPQVMAQVIADGLHVHPAALRLLLQIKGAHNVVLVSDATPVAGLPPGEYHWVGETIVVDDKGARLTDGTLAGSTTSLDQSLRVLVEQVGVPFEQALITATSAPARALGLRKGVVAPAYDADLVILDDSCRPLLTMVEGDIVYSQL
jgi:N-acetylglucosamine-6-phosphate deacetylase